MQTRNFLTALLLTISGFSAFGQSATDLNDAFSNRYFTHLYNFEFSKVKAMLDSVDVQHNFEKHLYFANYYFWRNITGDSSKNYFALSKKELNQQLKMKTVGMSDVDKIFYNSLTYSYLMRLELKNNNYLDAIKILDKSISHFEQALELKDKYEQFYLLSGMYNYFMGYTSEKYPVFNVYLKKFKPGNKETGIAQLKKSAESSNQVISTEALYFLVKIYLNTEKDYASARTYAEKLLKLHPDNIIYHREYYLVLVNLNLPGDIIKEKTIMTNLIDNNSQLNSMQKGYFKSLIK